MADASLGVLCVTFDNLGEAAQLGDGTWPSTAPLGEHFTVGVVGRLLDLLDRRAIAATFYVEAFNATLYPHLLREIARRGHEVAVHGWQHETWSALPAARERELLTRCTDALRELGLTPVGFRPPGGLVTAQTARELVRRGYRSSSPAGSRAGVADGLAVIPFGWPDVDAFYSAPAFARLRAQHGVAGGDAAALRRAGMLATLAANLVAGQPTTLVFHPMLLDDARAVGALEAVLAAAGGVECLTTATLAERMHAGAASLPAPLVETSSWAA
jgi:peptidoglycan/xylan/chitin deacetylase (PgdA/CDA1 family)